MYERILVTTDGSQAGDRAIERALDLADRVGAEIHALFVVDTIRPAGASTETPAEIEAQGSELLDDIVERSDQPVVSYFRHGRPDEVISEVRESADADLVICGIRRSAESGRDDRLPERIVRHTGPPVLTT